MISFEFNIFHYFLALTPTVDFLIKLIVCALWLNYKLNICAKIACTVRPVKDWVLMIFGKDLNISCWTMRTLRWSRKWNSLMIDLGGWSIWYCLYFWINLAKNSKWRASFTVDQHIRSLGNSEKRRGEDFNGEYQK